MQRAKPSTATSRTVSVAGSGLGSPPRLRWAVGLYPYEGDDLVSFALIRDLRRGIAPYAHRRLLPAAVTAGKRSLPNGLAPVELLAMEPREMPAGLAVCGGCTIVFKPQRKAHAHTCQRCAKRRPEPASFLHRWPGPGEAVPVRVPERKSAASDWREGLERWRTVYFACCAECHCLYMPTRKDAVVCWRLACKKRQSRRVRST